LDPPPAAIGAGTSRIAEKNDLMHRGTVIRQGRAGPLLDRLYVSACVIVYITLLGCVVVALQL
jgi:hypothetical protein